MAVGQVPGGEAEWVRNQRFSEAELSADERQAFDECGHLLAGGLSWSGFGDDKHLSLPSGVTFFPLPVEVSPVGMIGGVGLTVVGLSMFGIGIAAGVIQPGSSGLASGIVVGLLGIGMFVAGIVLLRMTARKYKAQETEPKPYGLYLLPRALVLRLPPADGAPNLAGWCERYPRSLVTIDVWQGWAGAGTSSQASGESRKYVRLRWTWPDGSAGERLLDWRVTGDADELPSALRSWQRRPPGGAHPVAP
ncbi:MAG: hypothetical protein JRI23_32945 [Deltaproteobacteria bacterium]|jgi:hypothetical protein|nr:hypothetical protein [Deltaproteobacteria bacterium]MBW2537061.1 hypothetical protein [Deltaproteobacteria bacterium]